MIRLNFFNSANKNKKIKVNKGNSALRLQKHGTHVCPEVLQQSHQNLGVIFRYSRNMKNDVHFSHIHNRVYSLNL